MNLCIYDNIWSGGCDFSSPNLKGRWGGGHWRVKYHSCDYKHQRLAWLDYSTTTKGFQENLIFWWELLNNPPILLEIKKKRGGGVLVTREWTIPIISWDICKLVQSASVVVKWQPSNHKCCCAYEGEHLRIAIIEVVLLSFETSVGIELPGVVESFISFD